MEPVNLHALALASWRHWREAPLVHIGVTLIILAASALTLGLAFGPLLVGYVRLIDKQDRGEPVRVADLGAAGDDLLASLATWIIVAVSVTLASLVIVLPGLVLALFWVYSLYLVALEHTRPIAALRTSWRLVATHLGPTLLVMLAATALLMAGTILIVGIVLSFPLATMLLTASFRALRATATPPPEVPAA